MKNEISMINLNFVLSPLDQFEVRDLLSLNANLLGNIHLSLTNIGLYLTIGISIILTYSLLATNNNKIIPNSWSISQESIYATVHSIVVSQINPTKGQLYFPFIYALFIFILVNNLIGLVLSSDYVFIEITSMLFNRRIINNNKIKGNSSSFSSSVNCRYYSSSSNNSNNCNPSISINPYYLSGFIDGEGCFNLTIYKNSQLATGWRIIPTFKISLHNKDRALLESIAKYLGVGKIYKHGKDSIDLRINGTKDLSVVIKHLDSYPLISQKFSDFVLFKQAVELIEQKEHLTEKGLFKIVSIKATLNQGLSGQLKEAFPLIIPIIRPSVLSTEIKNVDWLIGFVEADGCFQVVTQKNNNKTVVSLRFSLSQHSRDKVLLESLVNYLGCGRYYLSPTREEVYFIVSTFSDISNIIIPLFQKHPLLGSKKQDFLDLAIVAELIKSRDHQTEEGLAKISLIKSRMNSGRKH